MDFIHDACTLNILSVKYSFMLIHALSHFSSRDPGSPGPPPSNELQPLGGWGPPPTNYHQLPGGSEPLPSKSDVGIFNPPPASGVRRAQPRRPLKYPSNSRKYRRDTCTTIFRREDRIFGVLIFDGLAHRRLRGQPSPFSASPPQTWPRPSHWRTVRPRAAPAAPSRRLGPAPRPVAPLHGGRLDVRERRRREASLPTA